MKMGVPANKKIAFGNNPKQFSQVVYGVYTFLYHRKFISILLLFLFSIYPQILSAEKIWQEANSGIRDLDIRSVSIFPKTDNFICAASAKIVYLSPDSGESWREIFSLAAETAEINFVSFDPVDSRLIYLATSDGLFLTKDQGKTWQRIFRRIPETANNLSWIAFDLMDRENIYLGAKEGLYVSFDSGQSWRKAGGGLAHSPVRSVAVHPQNSQILYLANTYGLFKSIDKAETWERKFVTSYKIFDDEDDEDAQDEEGEQEENQSLIDCIAIGQRNPRRIFIATGEGVFVSQDAAGTWNKLPSEGLSCDEVNFIVFSDKEDALYAATPEGVFVFFSDLKGWQKIYQGMTAQNVRSLCLKIDSQELLAGTDKGVFKTIEVKNVLLAKEEMVREKNMEVDFEQMLQEFNQNEPTIGEVQQVALRYGEVIHPARIKSLRQDARLKALLPDVRLDYDKTIQEGGTSTHFGDFVIGPRDWGLTISWDVGDLVFSEQLRLIDSNARLAVQLRDDILNEVTRLFYERRRLQTELILSPPKTTEEKINKHLRLEELTANIDALTGGYFSRQLEERRSNEDAIYGTK